MLPAFDVKATTWLLSPPTLHAAKPVGGPPHGETITSPRSPAAAALADARISLVFTGVPKSST
ncbi:MAG: hypothetical protein ACXVZ3_02440 [Gaiellaceae bacterium]